MRVLHIWFFKNVCVGVILSCVLSSLGWAASFDCNHPEVPGLLKYVSLTQLKFRKSFFLLPDSRDLVELDGQHLTIHTDSGTCSWAFPEEISEPIPLLPEIMFDPGHVGSHPFLDQIRLDSSWCIEWDQRPVWWKEGDLTYWVWEELERQWGFWSELIACPMPPQPDSTRLKGEPAIGSLFWQMFSSEDDYTLQYQDFLKEDLKARARLAVGHLFVSIHFNFTKPWETMFKSHHEIDLIEPNPVMVFVPGGYSQDDIEREGWFSFLANFLNPYWDQSVFLASRIVHNLVQYGTLYGRTPARIDDPRYFFRYFKNSVWIKPGVFARSLAVFQKFHNTPPHGISLLVEGDLINSQSFLNGYQQNAFEYVRSYARSLFESISELFCQHPSLVSWSSSSLK